MTSSGRRPASDKFRASASNSSCRRMTVSSSWSVSLTVAGMIANPSGSGPIHETNRQDLPPSVVRTQSGRPSCRLAFAAVRNNMQSDGPFTM